MLDCANSQSGCRFGPGSQSDSQDQFENPLTELEVHFRGESLIERQAKMRQRAKELAEKRESERLKIVNEKNEQQWRQECVGKF